MKTKLSRFATYGIENDDQDLDGQVAATQVDADLPVIDETKSDEVAELETEKAENEVAEVEGDINEMTDTVESLEAICFGIEATLKKGGLSRQGAAFALQSADLQLNRLGLSGPKASVEDFEEAPVAVTTDAGTATDPIAEDTISAGGNPAPVDGDNKTSVEPDAASAVGSDEAGIADKDNTDAGEPAAVLAPVPANVAVSQEAMEDIKAKIKAIWEAITKAFATFIERVKGFFAKIGEFTMRQARACGELAKSAAAAPGNYFKNKKVKVKTKAVLDSAGLKKMVEECAKAGADVEAKLKKLEADLDAAYKMVLSKDEDQQNKGAEAIKKALADFKAIEDQKLLTVDIGGETTTLDGNGTVGTGSQEETFEGEFEAIPKEEIAKEAKAVEDVASDSKLSKIKGAISNTFNSILEKSKRFATAVGVAFAVGATLLVGGAAILVVTFVGTIASTILGIGKMVFGIASGIAKLVSKGVSNCYNYLKAMFQNLTTKEKEGEGDKEAAAA